LEKELRVVSNPSSLLSFLPKALGLIKTEYPFVDITINEESTSNIIEIIKHNDADIGFTLVNEYTWVRLWNLYKKDLHFDTLHQGSIYVCVSKSSFLALKNSLTPGDLLQYTHILYNTADSIYKDIIKQYGPIKFSFKSSNLEIVKK